MQTGPQAATTGHELDYERDPREIYRRSFEVIRAEVDLAGLPRDLEPLVVRLVHACGMPDIIEYLAFDPMVGAAAGRALRDGAPVLADCRMVAEGIIRRHLPAENEVVCALDDPGTRALATQQATTRSAAAIELLGPRLGGGVVAIGNAPTALFRLLELLEDGGPRPAAILAFPVGFVGAAEAKEALAAGGYGVPYVTLMGRRGGSALAAAAVNALAGSEPGSGDRP